jgi:hypothetical protein
LEQRLRRAGMRQSACLENLDLRTPRGLDRSTMQALASGLWIRQHRNVSISGAAGIGKSWTLLLGFGVVILGGVATVEDLWPHPLETPPSLAEEPMRYGCV